MSKLEEIVKYGVYGAKRALFITPMYYVAETISGLDSSQSLKTRALALGVNFFVAMPYHNWFKPKVYELMGVTELSPSYKKDLANRIAFAAHQIPLYTGILIAAGATPEQIAITLPTGVAVGAATAGKFQDFMDKASDFLENGLYKTKNKLSHSINLGKSYAKNLAIATIIAAMAKTTIHHSTNYVKENSILTNSDKLVHVIDIPTEAWTYIKKEDFDPARHFLVYSKDVSKVSQKPNYTVF